MTTAHAPGLDVRTCLDERISDEPTTSPTSRDERDADGSGGPMSPRRLRRLGGGVGDGGDVADLLESPGLSRRHEAVSVTTAKGNAAGTRGISIALSSVLAAAGSAALSHPGESRAWLVCGALLSVSGMAWLAVAQWLFVVRTNDLFSSILIEFGRVLDILWPLALMAIFASSLVVGYGDLGGPVRAGLAVAAAVVAGATTAAAELARGRLADPPVHDQKLSQ